MIATFVEDPLTLQETIKVPDDHWEACKAGGVATEGNAAGNTVDYLDLTGQNVPPKGLPAGYVLPSLSELSRQLTCSSFTPRGIVALVFSCICGILGVVVVAWYGLSVPTDEAPKGVRETIASAGIDDVPGEHHGEGITSGTGHTGRA